MSELAKGKWWLRAAAVTVAATVSLGPTAQLSHATESGQTVASTSVVAHDFDGGDVSWSEIAKETGFPEAKITGDPVLFSLAKVAEQRKLGLKNLWDEFRKQPTGATLADLAKKARYTVDSNPAAGAVAQWGSNTKIVTDEWELPIGDYGFAAYVTGVFDEQGKKMVEVEGYGFGDGGGYGTARIEASQVTNFVHLEKAPAPKVVSPPPASSPGTVTEIPAQEIKDDFPAAQLAKEAGLDIDESIRQCGYFALWRVLDRSGLTMTDYSVKSDALETLNNAEKSSQTAAGMDDYLAQFGARVDDKPAVGAIASWEANTKVQVGGKTFTTPAPGHAAYVSRVYLIDEKDAADAEDLANDMTPDYTELAALLAKAKTSTGKKVPFVLLEDYNGHAGPNKYGVKVMPASKVGHFIHLTGTEILKKATPGERMQAYLKTHPEIAQRFGNPVGEPTLEGDLIKQKFEKGTFALNVKPKGTDAESEKSAPGPADSGKSAVDKSAEAPRVVEKIQRVLDLYREKLVSPELQQRIEKLKSELARVQKIYPATKEGN